MNSPFVPDFPGLRSIATNFKRVPRLLAIVAILLSISASAQRFGGTPPSVKWRQISTDSARVIFPQGLDSIAQRIATLVHYQAATKPASLGDQLDKVNIVLQNQTTIANAYVGLSPFRSEFYLTPSPDNFDLGSLSWPDQLAIHEYRHVEQFNNFHNGLSQVMRVLFGEDGYALAINASIPDWFYEGDAVYNETVLSTQGRGRLPLFLNAYPSLWRAKKDYSWMKLRNGSLKDYVPDHYHLGYLLVNFGREKYGLDFWQKVTHDASSFRGLIYPFQKAIEKYTGMKYMNFVKAAFAYYKAQSAEKATTANEAGPDPVFPLNKRVLTNYLYPYSISSDSTLYLKTSNDRRPTFFIKDGKGEHMVRVRDIAINDQYSYRNGSLVYAAYETDSRWHWRDYSVIKVVDVNSGKERTLTHRSKYFTPDISPGGNRVAAVEIGIDGKSELHILDAGNGEVINRIAKDGIALFTDPKFMSEDSIVCAARTTDGRMSLVTIDIASGAMQTIIPPTNNVIGFPCVSNDRIYFTASFGGADNVFAIDRARRIFRLTDWPLGNYFVNVANGKMTWSAFTADGYQLQQTDESKLVWEPVSPYEVDALHAPFTVSHEKQLNEIVPGNLAARNFPTSKYRKGTGLFNFHSWRPYYEDPEFTFSIYGQNVLNTLETEIYYLYNENEKTHAVGASAVYGGLFPYITLGSQYTFNRKAVASNRIKQWDQTDTRIGLSIPLSWVTGQTTKQLNFGTNLAYRQDINKGFYKDTFTTVSFAYLNHFISFSEYVESARQHIFPRLGYALSASYRYVLNKYDSWEFLGSGSVYLPGLLPTHSLVLSGGYQETDTTYALFGNNLAYARGYNAAFFSRMWRLSANYHFPLVYPDWGFGNILYLQRVRANAFYDLTRVFSNNKLATADQRSVGGELFVDTRWWNQYELTFGFRVSHLLDRDFYTGRSGTTVFEFIVPVSIIPR